MTATDPAEHTGGLWLCDVNVLVALALTTHVHHRPAHEALARHTGTWATCPMTEAALLRLLLDPRVAGRSFTTGEVLRVASGMRTHPRWRWIADDTSLAAAAIDTTGLRGHRQVTDFHLVNLARVNGAQLVTFDAAIQAGLSPPDRRWVRVLPQ